MLKDPKHHRIHQLMYMHSCKYDYINKIKYTFSFKNLFIFLLIVLLLTLILTILHPVSNKIVQFLE